MMTSTSAASVGGVHHFAYKCRDAEETRHFYEDILELPLAMVVEESNHKTTTGDVLSFAHFFFQMQDGNYIAFFDFGDATASVPDPATPRFANHLALRVAGEEDLLRSKARLEAHGIDVIGPLEHEFVRSIYFWDPNGIRLEYAYTVSSDEDLANFKASARERLDRWIAGVKQKRGERPLA